MNTNKPEGSIESIGERIAWICFKYYDGNYSKMARALDVTEPSVRNYIKKGRVPKSDVMARLVVDTGIDANWLLLGSTSVKRSRPEVNIDEVLKHTQAIESLVKQAQ